MGFAMRIRLGLFVAGVVAAANVAAAGQSTPAAPANDDCLTCHDAIAAKRFEASIHGPMNCVDCHADAAKELPHPERLAKAACGSCHDDVAGKYHDSIHAWAKEKAGLLVAPACADCHGKHDIAAHTDTASRVYRDRIPATCGG